MRSILNQVQQLSENAMTRIDVEATTFNGDINEAFNSFNIMIAEEMNESSAASWFHNSLLLETGATNPSKFSVINENIFSNFIEGVKKFFKSIVSFIKGIIEKIKVMIVSHTGSISQWEKIVLPKVEKNMNDAKIKDNFNYNGYEWKDLSGIEKLVDKTAIDTLVTAIDTFKSYVSDQKGKLKGMVNFSKDQTDTPAATSDESVDNITETHRKAAGINIDKSLSNDRAKDKIKDTVMDDFGKKKSIDDYIKEEVKAIKSSDKIEITKFNKGPGISVMIDFIKKSKDTLEKLSTDFDNLKDKYDKVVTVLEDLDVDVDLDGIKDSQRKSNYDKKISIIKDVIELKKHEISLRQSCFTAISAKQRSLVQEATKEFMVILGAFANAKAPKHA